MPPCDKNGGLSTGSSIRENPMQHANLMAQSWAIEVYIVGIGIFDFFCSCNLEIAQ